MNNRQSHSRQPPQVCILVSCPYSGVAPLMRLFTEHPDCHVTNSLALADITGLDRSIGNSVTSHRVFSDCLASHGRWLISDIEVGDGEEWSHQAHLENVTTRPVLVVRDPIRVLKYWKENARGSAYQLIGLFKNMFQMLEQVPADANTIILYEKLISYMIEEHLGRLYLRSWQNDAQELQKILLEKTWIGFDLDDTLHEFRRASSAATIKVLAEISAKHGVPIEALSKEYSKERFRSTLDGFALPYDEPFMTELLECYETTLVASLELKCGAVGLLSTIKNMGKKIVVITEGPQDSQERTIDALGIGGYVDFVATTNRFRVAKTDGLFGKVLAHLGISSSDVAYVGDSEQRDMVPAMAAGIFSIHLAEEKDALLTASPPRINTLRKLQYIIS
ncbi:hypothetical protein ACCO45_000556 [Purpureocillium lilacinum]|uniref:Uncharacterized protein n=1 Tax=Purpureocillium lilacinum TaxID=33203 RepID=A0ACC4E5N4_PURLI